MLLAEAWTRYWRSWKALIAANLCSQVLMLLLVACVLLLTVGQLLIDPTALTPQLIQQMGMRTLAAWPVVFLLSGCFVQGGLVGTVAAVWRDPDAPWTAFWSQAWYNWWRMIRIAVATGLGLLLPAVLVLSLLGWLIYLSPVPVLLSGLAYLLLGVFGVLPLTSAVYYGGYAAVADRAGGRHAVREGWRCITAGYADCLAAAMLLILLSLVVAVLILPLALILALAGVPPLLGQLLVNLVHIIIAPTFVLVYMAGRYETNQRPR